MNAYYMYSKILPNLRSGDKVRVKTTHDATWSAPATVVRQHDAPRSYIVQTSDGLFRRNRAHLQKVPEMPETSPVDTPKDELTSPPDSVANNMHALSDSERCNARPPDNTHELSDGDRCEARKSGRQRKPPGWLNSYQLG